MWCSTFQGHRKSTKYGAFFNVYALYIVVAEIVGKKWVNLFYLLLDSLQDKT